jgi:hypothetical protein
MELAFETCENIVEEYTYILLMLKTDAVQGRSKFQMQHLLKFTCTRTYT